MLEEIIRDIKDNLQMSAKKLFDVELSARKIPVDINFNAKIGDLSTTIAFGLSKKLTKKPIDIADALSSEIDQIKYIKEIKVVKPGYINFYIDEGPFLKEVVNRVLDQKDKFGHTTKYEGKTILIEHTSMNPTGPVNIGRIRNSFIGDCLVRLHKAIGWNVKVHYYINDMGRQVAIIAWAFDKDIPEKDELIEKYKEFKNKPDFKVFFKYVAANEILKEEPAYNEVIDLLLQKCEKGDMETIKKLNQYAKMGLNGQLETIRKFGINYDSFDFESKFIIDGSVSRVIKKLKALPQSKMNDDGSYSVDLSEFGIKKGPIYKDEYDGEYGKEDEILGYYGTIFQRADGTSVYVTRDIAYHEWKFNLGIDKALTVLGEDHKIEFKEIKTLLKLLGIIKKDEELDVVFISFVNLKGKRMSTRKGETVPLDRMIETGINKALKIVKNNYPDMDEDLARDIASKIALGAIKYNILKDQPLKSILFTWDDALNFEGESSPYIQYAYARACSILKKSKTDIRNLELNIENIHMKEETILLKEISRFPLVILNSAEQYKPHYLAKYTYRIAKLFTDFYHKCPVMFAETEDIKNNRLLIVKCTQQVLKNSLFLLGIEPLEVM